MTPINVAIVGSSGFIARHLINHLKKDPSLNLFLFGRSATSNTGIPYSTINFSDEAGLREGFANIDVVYHLVSDTIPSSSWEDPLREIDRNLVPFTKFMNVISGLKVKKVAFISSAGTVYGPTVGKVEESSNKMPFSPYGIIKLTMENLLNYYHVKYGIHYDVYRVSNVYGQGQDTSKGLGLINTFLEKIISEKKVSIFGDGASTRNYIFAPDVAALIAESVRDLAHSGVYNVSSDDTLSVSEVIAILKDTVDEQFEVNYLPGRKSDNSYIDLDNSRILARCRDFSFTNINEGIKQTYLAIKQHNHNG